MLILTPLRNRFRWPVACLVLVLPVNLLTLPWVVSLRQCVRAKSNKVQSIWMVPFSVVLIILSDKQTGKLLIYLRTLDHSSLRDLVGHSRRYKNSSYRQRRILSVRLARVVHFLKNYFAQCHILFC